jgi:hypothetical protein
MRIKTSGLSPARDCQNNPVAGFHGLASRSSSERQSGGAGSHNQAEIDHHDIPGVRLISLQMVRGVEEIQAVGFGERVETLGAIGSMWPAARECDECRATAAGAVEKSE